MINKVQFHNFKALRDVTVDLTRLTVLVGPNGSGKTSVLQGLSYLADAQNWRNAGDVLGGVQNALALVSAGAGPEMVLMCDDDRGWLRVEKDARQHFQSPTKDFARFDLDVALTEAGPQVRLGILRGGEFAGAARLGPAMLLRLDLKQIIAPSYSESPNPQLDSDGAGLASTLAYIASDHPARFEELLDALRSVIPSVDDIRFPRARVVRPESEIVTFDGKTYTRQSERVFWGNAMEFDFQGASRIPAHMVSEGTLLVLALLTALMGPARPRLVLLDDLDRALHPQAQRDLVGLLRRLLDQASDLQIVATSHSPYLLDQLQPEEVRLTTIKDDGSVACAGLDQHPEFEQWKETMASGEFWSFVGEAWVADVGAREWQP
jgi:predicted ATPase